MHTYSPLLSSPHRRMAMGCALIYALLMSGFMTDLVMRQQNLLQSQQVQSALRLADSIAQQSTQALLDDNPASLSQVTSSFKAYPEVDGMMITDPSGRVLAHPDERRMGGRLSDARSKEVLQGAREHALVEQTPQRMEVMSPVMQGSHLLGWARLSLDAQDNQTQINEVLQLGVGFAVLMVVLGSTTIYLIAGQVIKRLGARPLATAPSRRHICATASTDGTGAVSPAPQPPSSQLPLALPEPTGQPTWPDRNVLLKEIFHRVKNNLQVVQSLLSLQQRAAQDPEVRQALDASVRRIRAMGLVHEMLYQSGDLSAIALPDYVNRLVDELKEAQGQAHFHLDIPAVTVPLDSAVPLGLLLTELISNSLQHAFPGDRAGDVWIRVTPLAGNYIRLHVSDNGVGFERHAHAEQPGAVGLKLAHALASQLGGVLQRQEAQGTAFEAVLSLF